MSKDSGQTWKRVNSLNPRPFYFSNIRVDPNDDKVLYVLGRHDRSGRAPTAGSGSPPARSRGVHPDHHALWIDPKDSRHMLIGCDGGFYATYDRGTTWDHLNILALGQFYHVAWTTRSRTTSTAAFRTTAAGAGRRMTLRGERPGQRRLDLPQRRRRLRLPRRSRSTRTSCTPRARAARSIAATCGPARAASSVSAAAVAAAVAAASAKNSGSTGTRPSSSPATTRSIFYVGSQHVLPVGRPRGEPQGHQPGIDRAPRRGRSPQSPRARATPSALGRAPTTATCGSPATAARSGTTCLTTSRRPGCRGRAGWPASSRAASSKAAAMSASTPTAPTTTSRTCT